MTSAMGGSPLPESLSGPCRRLRYHELNTHKVTKSLTEGRPACDSDRRVTVNNIQVILVCGPPR